MFCLSECNKTSLLQRIRQWEACLVDCLSECNKISSVFSYSGSGCDRQIRCFVCLRVTRYFLSYSESGCGRHVLPAWCWRTTRVPRPTMDVGGCSPLSSTVSGGGCCQVSCQYTVFNPFMFILFHLVTSHISSFSIVLLLVNNLPLAPIRPYIYNVTRTGCF